MNGVEERGNGEDELLAGFCEARRHFFVRWFVVVVILGFEL